LSPGLIQISQYLETNIEQGKLPRVDPEILTTALMMTTFVHPGVSRLIDRNHSLHQGSPGASRTYSRFWLALLAPG
jgi:hypothetical protein